jgi:hypothetical protein
VSRSGSFVVQKLVTTVELGVLVNLLQLLLKVSNYCVLVAKRLLCIV